MTKTINVILVVVIIALATSAAFFLLSPKNVEPGTTPGFILEEALKATGNIEVGSEAPGFTLTNIKTDETFTLEDLKGKPVFIEFGSTFCGICRFDMNNLDEFFTKNKALLKDAYGDKLTVIWVNIDPLETASEVEKYSRSYDNGNDWIWTRDTDTVAIRYGAPFTGTTYLIDKDGKVVYKDGANTYYDTILKEVSKVLT